VKALLWGMLLIAHQITHSMQIERKKIPSTRKKEVVEHLSDIRLQLPLKEQIITSYSATPVTICRHPQYTFYFITMSAQHQFLLGCFNIRGNKIYSCLHKQHNRTAYIRINSAIFEYVKNQCNNYIENLYT
jgi:hypothetical protein